HTRFSRDWSSDVCSSDLDEVPVLAVRDETGGERVLADERLVARRLVVEAEPVAQGPDVEEPAGTVDEREGTRIGARPRRQLGVRSEERRGGEGRGSRGTP